MQHKVSNILLVKNHHFFIGLLDFILKESNDESPPFFVVVVNELVPYRIEIIELK